MSETDAESRVAALEQRIIELEIAGAFRQRTLDELDEALRRQADQLDRLELALAKLVAERQAGLDLHADPSLDPEEDDPF